MTLVCRPFHFFLDIRYRFTYSPFCVSLRSSGRRSAAFFLPGRSFSLLNPLECALPRSIGFCTILVQISPLESTLTDCALVSPLEYALTKTGGRVPTRKRRKFKNRSDSPGSFSQSSDPLTWSVPLPAQGSLPTLAKGSSRSPGKSDAAAR